jgi:hypothetical protein
VDLTLRHLPKLFQWARHLSNADPLVEQIKKIAVAWPLSSAGTPGLATPESREGFGAREKIASSPLPSPPREGREKTQWPNLSAALKLDSFLGDPALRRLYADRVLACGDTSRLGDARLDDLLRGDLGIHRDLAPEIAGKLLATQS